MSGKDGVKIQVSKETKDLLVSIGEAASKLDDKEVVEQEEASLGDLMGFMGGLMAAFAPPEQAKEIEKQFEEMGKTMGPMLGVLAKGAGAFNTPAYHWVDMNSDVLPENALAAGLDRAYISISNLETQRFDSGTPNVYVARVEIDGKFWAGKVHNGTRYCWKPDMGEKEVTSEPFSVLCVDPNAELEWVKYDSRAYSYEIPLFRDMVLPKGIVTAGKDCYVGRGHVYGDKDKLTPGLIHTQNRAGKDKYSISMLFGGKAHREFDFEYLVIKSEKQDVKDAPAE